MITNGKIILIDTFIFNMLINNRLKQKQITAQIVEGMFVNYSGIINCRIQNNNAETEI